MLHGSNSFFSLLYVGWKQTKAREASSILPLYTLAQMPCTHNKTYYVTLVSVSPINNSTVQSARVHNMVKVRSFVYEHRFRCETWSCCILSIFSIIAIYCTCTWSKIRGWLRLRGRVSLLLSEGWWFDSPGLQVEVSLGKILNPKLLLMCWLTPYMAATTISI